jgi:hypothetical protein
LAGGAAITIPTTAALYGACPAGAQTVTYLENY